MKVTVVTNEKPDICITLTNTEAHILLAVCWNVGGSHDGPRNLIEKLTDALANLGIEAEDHYAVNGSLHIEAQTS